MEVVTYLPESRFTQPTYRCPEPGRWTSADDHSTEREVSEMIAGLVRGLQPDVAVETGAAFGQTAELIGHALLANGYGHLYSFEPDLDRHAYALGRTAGMPVEVIPLESISSWEPPGEIGFAFFDSLFNLRVPEFQHYRRWMTDRTIVAFHDTAPQAGGGQLGDWYDLATQIEHELTRPGFLRTIDLPTPRGIVIGQVV